MFDGAPGIPPLPTDATPIGPGGHFVLFVLVYLSLVATAYFFFEFSWELMDEEARRDLKQFHQTYLRDWWRK